MHFRYDQHLDIPNGIHAALRGKLMECTFAPVWTEPMESSAFSGGGCFELGSTNAQTFATGNGYGSKPKRMRLGGGGGAGGSAFLYHQLTELKALYGMCLNFNARLQLTSAVSMLSAPSGNIEFKKEHRDAIVALLPEYRAIRQKGRRLIETADTTVYTEKRDINMRDEVKQFEENVVNVMIPNGGLTVDCVLPFLGMMDALSKQGVPLSSSMGPLLDLAVRSTTYVFLKWRNNAFVYSDLISYDAVDKNYKDSVAQTARVFSAIAGIKMGLLNMEEVDTVKYIEGMYNTFRDPADPEAPTQQETERILKASMLPALFALNPAVLDLNPINLGGHPATLQDLASRYFDRVNNGMNCRDCMGNSIGETFTFPVGHDLALEYAFSMARCNSPMIDRNLEWVDLFQSTGIMLGGLFAQNCIRRAYYGEIGKGDLRETFTGFTAPLRVSDNICSHQSRLAMLATGGFMVQGGLLISEMANSLDDRSDAGHFTTLVTIALTILSLELKCYYRYGVLQPHNIRDAAQCQAWLDRYKNPANTVGFEDMCTRALVSAREICSDFQSGQAFNIDRMLLRYQGFQYLSIQPQLGGRVFRMDIVLQQHFLWSDVHNNVIDPRQPLLHNIFHTQQIIFQELFLYLRRADCNVSHCVQDLMVVLDCQSLHYRVNNIMGVHAFLLNAPIDGQENAMPTGADIPQQDPSPTATGLSAQSILADAPAQSSEHTGDTVAGDGANPLLSTILLDQSERQQALASPQPTQQAADAGQEEEGQKQGRQAKQQGSAKDKFKRVPAKLL